jgi:hypothetical protein
MTTNCWRSSMNRTNRMNLMKRSYLTMNCSTTMRKTTTR